MIILIHQHLKHRRRATVIVSFIWFSFTLIEKVFIYQIFIAVPNGDFFVIIFHSTFDSRFQQMSSPGVMKKRFFFEIKQII